VPGVLVNLASFSFAPSTGVFVRDVWANTTSGPVYGNFTTRALQGHETLLLRLTVAVTGWYQRGTQDRQHHSEL
jgi:hypothetical protein